MILHVVSLKLDSYSPCHEWALSLDKVSCHRKFMGLLFWI